MLKRDINLKSKETIYRLLLVLVIVCLYSFSWNYPIYGGWDDVRYILNNHQLSLTFSNIFHWFTNPCVGCYLPLTMLSYMFDYSLWGLDSFGYHLQNIFWHIVATLAIYSCFRLFKIKPWITFFLCLIFAIHPQRVESVVWLSERKDVLCTAFYFLSIYFYVKNCNKGFSVIAFSIFILSMLSKSMAMSLPIVLLFYEFYRQRSFNIKYYFTRLWPYFLVSCVFLPITIFVQGGSFNSSFSSYCGFYRLIFNLFWYFKQTLLPNGLNPIYPLISISTTIPVLTIFYVVSIIIFSITWLKNRSALLYCALPVLFCYIFSILPVGGLFLLGGTDHADRYSYIPSVFIWFSVGLILTRLLSSEENGEGRFKKSFLLGKKFIFIAFSLYAIILIELNYQYQKVWHSHFSVFYYAANSVSASSVALHYLAELEMSLGNYDKVLELAERLDQIRKDSLPAFYLRATVAYYSGHKAKAAKVLARLLPLYRTKANERSKMNSAYFKILNMLVDCSYSSGNFQETIEYIEEILQFYQSNEFGYLFCRGLKAQCQKNYSGALSWYKKAWLLTPDNKKLRENVQLCFEARKEGYNSD